MKRYLSGILILALFFACKDDDDSSSKPGGSNPGAGNLAACLILTEEITYGNDSTDRTNINYTYTNNLLTEKVFNYHNNPPVSNTYLYNNANKLKYILTDQFFGQTLDTTYKFKYDISDRLTKITILSNGQVSFIINFSYSGSRLSGILAEYDNFETERYIVQSDNKGNITQLELIELNGKAPDNKILFSLIYDDGINPFKGFYDSEIIIWNTFATNNVKEVKVLEDGINTSTTTYNYTYNSFGYPLTTVQVEGPYIESHVYSYSCN